MGRADRSRSHPLRDPPVIGLPSNFIISELMESLLSNAPIDEDPIYHQVLIRVRIPNDSDPFPLYSMQYTNQSRQQEIIEDRNLRDLFRRVAEEEKAFTPNPPKGINHDGKKIIRPKTKEQPENAAQPIPTPAAETPPAGMESGALSPDRGDLPDVGADPAGNSR